MSNQISVTMITKNAATTLEKSLESLKSFPEIIVLDSGSTDSTIKIAKKFANVQVFESPFIGFGPLKNLALAYASNDWILSIDSDEVLTQALIQEIQVLQLENSFVYSILRDNYYKEQHMKCCGWEGDFVLRLFNKSFVKFNSNQVHESLQIPSSIKIQKLQYTMKHYTYQSIEQLIQKMEHYSTLWAEDYTGKKSSSIPQAILRSWFAFVKFYLFKRGFLNGYQGLIISVTNANGVFYKYMKLYERNKKDSR